MRCLLHITAICLRDDPGQNQLSSRVDIRIGYLMSEYSDEEGSLTLPARHATSYVCVDQAPEIAAGGVNQKQAVILVVKVACGVLPCSTYP